jgi:hypothetical protein
MAEHITEIDPVCKKYKLTRKGAAGEGLVLDASSRSVLLKESIGAARCMECLK